MEKIVLSEYTFKGKKSISKGAKELIKGILEANPWKWYSIKDIKNDKWFSVDFVDDINDYIEEEKKFEDGSEYDYTPISILSPEHQKFHSNDDDEGFTAIYKKNFAFNIEEKEVQTEPYRLNAFDLLFFYGGNAFNNIFSDK